MPSFLLYGFVVRLCRGVEPPDDEPYEDDHSCNEDEDRIEQVGHVQDAEA